MIGMIRATIYVFLAITLLTAILVVVALGKLWLFSSADQTTELPYLEYLLATLLVEIFAVVVTYAKKGTKYLPHVESHTDEAATMEFMTKFISQGSTIQIVSNRLAWVKEASNFAEVLKETVANNGLVDIVTPQEVPLEIRGPLQNAGVNFFVTRENTPPESRFTLINGNRNGAERLAIARGSHPDHEVTVFDSNSGPQMIGMAKDIIRKSKEISNA